MEKGERTIKIDLTRRGIKRITMLPLDDEGMEILKKHGMDAEEAFGDLYDKVWREDAGQLMDFVFEHAYSEYGHTYLTLKPASEATNTLTLPQN